MDYYEVLGCSEKASHEDIKRAYHERVLKSHPDKIKDSEQSVEKFHRIQEAWEILSNLESRKLYDAEREQARLEEKRILLYASITSDELYPKDNNLAYQCRCGSEYIVEQKVLEEYEEFYVPCDDCTFNIYVEVKKKTKNLSSPDTSGS